MTTSAPNPETMPEAAPVAAVAPRRRRRRMAALLVVLGLVALFAVVTSWYITTRKPIEELPLPGLSEEQLPHYAYSIYGVTNPVGVAATASGDRVYVAETGGKAVVHIYDGKGTELGTMQPPGTTQASRLPVYVAIDPTNGDVYVSDRVAASIEVYDRNGTYLRTFKPTAAVTGWQPLGLAFDAQGRLYVGDVGSSEQRILVFDRGGALVRTIGPGQFSFPNGLSIDARGDLFIADGNNGRLAMSDASGAVTTAIPRGVAAGELGLPRGTAIDDAGRLYVADTNNHIVQVYRLDDKTGRPKYIGAVGAEGRGDGEFWFPNGVATDTRARIYVSDWANNRVQVWSY